MDGLLALGRPLALGGGGEDGPPLEPPLEPLGQRIAVARDAAFAFSYASVIEGWREAGAEVNEFSPLKDEAPEADADAVYLPGGYPELHAGRLAGAETFMAGLRTAADRGAQMFGECGGYMVLGRGLVDAEGNRHAMAGLLGVETSFAEAKLHRGYRRLKTVSEGPLGAKGTAFRGHEFHYAKVIEEAVGKAGGKDGATPLFEAEDAEGNDLGAVGLAGGLSGGRVAGSFIHLIDRE